MFIGRSAGPLGSLPCTCEKSAPVQPVASTSARPSVLGSIPDGFGGTSATLRIMRQFVRDAVRDPDQIVRTKAEELTRDLPARNWFAQIRALHEFVRDQIRYLRDPVSVERVATPQATLEIGQGDCDDKATLLAALLDSIGHPTRFVAVGFKGQGFSHVLVETKISNTGNDRRDWLPLETIIPVAAGWFPQGVTSAYRLKV